MKETTLIYTATHAKELFRKYRWGDTVTCPHCGATHIYHYKDGTYKCANCHKRFTDKTGTIWQGSKLSLEQIVITVYLMLDGKGMSSIEVARKVGYTQKTAWYACNRVRWAFDQDDIILEGNVAMDEVYLNGSWTNFPTYKKIHLLQKYGLWQTHQQDNFGKVKMHKVVNQYKQPVYGLNDGRQIVLKSLPNDFDPSALSEIFNQNASSASLALSDQSKLYNHWKQRTGVQIETNNHSKGCYRTISGHTSNPIEGTFSNLKRQNLYNYVHFDKNHSQLYLNDFVFRWNHRGEDIQQKLSAAFVHFHKVVTRQEILDYDTRSRYRTIERKWTFEELVQLLEMALIQSIEINGTTYTLEDAKAALAAGIKYPI